MSHKVVEVKQQQVLRQVKVLVFNLTNDLAAKGDEQGTTRNLAVNFNVDEMVLRQVIVSGTANPGVITFIACDNIRDPYLCALSGSANEMTAPNTVFQMNGGPVASVKFGFYAYDATDATQPPVTTDTVAQVAITLEFRGKKPL